MYVMGIFMAITPLPSAHEISPSLDFSSSSSPIQNSVGQSSSYTSMTDASLERGTEEDAFERQSESGEGR